MKVHQSVPAKVYGSLENALCAWGREKLIPSEARDCDGFMMSLKEREFLTDNKELVTCKKCLRKSK